MSEEFRDFIRWLYSFVEHDQWDKDRVEALLELLHDAGTGEAWNNTNRSEKSKLYASTIDSIRAIKSWQE